MLDTPPPTIAPLSRAISGEIFLPEGDLLDLEPYEGMKFEFEEAAKASTIPMLGFVKEHNHELVPPDQVHCLHSHRQISGPAKTSIDTLQATSMGPRRIMFALIKEYDGISKVEIAEVDCRNYTRNNC
ncbi:hypothetical protein GH714_015412 [Hevea brasiliensis]|uniref:Uncharacterized protein n=1 Tax=Hevea brasiliensis TaxID=3981 RepID=A0A6A6KBZ6_HEVBR|nr:hypothetical protein GH714_015412 [Hevea brasiliensis]